MHQHHTFIKDDEEMSKAGFSTPENDKFYQRQPYEKLNSVLKEIRLLRVQRQLLTISEIKQKWPQWCDSLDSCLHKPKPCGKKPEEPPGDGPIYALDDSDACIRLSTEIFDGWEQFFSSKMKLVSLSKHKDEYQSQIKMKLTIPFQNPWRTDRIRFCYKPWYFNIYTGESTWDPPTEPAYSLPKFPMVVCELIDTIPLASLFARHRKYVTLSYCAGDPGQTTEIIVNGLIFNAFRNLAHALECIVQYWAQHSSEDLLIWTDQVCINQSDHIEKSHQVNMMGEIFKRS